MHIVYYNDYNNIDIYYGLKMKHRRMILSSINITYFRDAQNILRKIFTT